ncbi:MAG: hypothetical protein B7X50_11775 [Alishewanella sp. 34-51-39]|jgi:hypothetical protein|nr:MAG: hypothetical protein B7X50_11775 [Alishewanella sp. 34-51-39]
MKIKKTHKLSKPITLLSTAMALMPIAHNVGAQDSTDEASVERIAVTGSLLRKASGFGEKSPVKVVNRDDFMEFSPTSINDIGVLGISPSKKT